MIGMNLPAVHYLTMFTICVGSDKSRGTLQEYTLKKHTVEDDCESTLLLIDATGDLVCLIKG